MSANFSRGCLDCQSLDTPDVSGPQYLKEETCLLQERLASGEDVFGPLLRKFLLNNSHRVTVELLPDSKLGAEQEQSEKAKLKTYQESLSPDAIEATIHKTKELKERQVILYLVPPVPSKSWVDTAGLYEGRIPLSDLRPDTGFLAFSWV